MPSVEGLQRSLTEAKRQERQNGSATVSERRDMLVLKAHHDADRVREEPVPYGEWEPDNADPKATKAPIDRLDKRE